MGDRPGDKVGPRLAQLIGQYTLAARRDHAPIEAKIHQVATQALIDRAGHEMADHVAPFLRGAIDANPDMHADIRAYLERTASGRHQLQAVAGNLVLGAAGSVLGTVISNELAPFGYSIVSANPHLRLDPQTAAVLYAKGIFSQQDMYNEGAASGLNSVRMDSLESASQSVPDSATIGDLINRGLMSETDGEFWVRRGGYGPSLHRALLAARRQLLSPADAALAVLRGIITQAEGEAHAALAGVDAADFAVLIGNTGEPLAIEQLMEARRRGFIDDAQFDRGFRQSRYRNEWIPTAHKLFYAPMSTADAVDAVVQGHLSEPDGRAKAEQNGLESGDWPALLATAGEPLSRTEMEQLYNRGKVSKDQVDQALRESRIKNKYIPLAFALHERLPEGRQIVSAITHGALSKQEALSLLGQLGYSPQVAGILVAEGTNARVGAHKELTIGEIRALYTAGVFTAAHVAELLSHLGFDTADAAALRKGWDLLAAAAITRQAIGAVRSKYVSRHIDATQAKADLEQLNVGGTARDRYLQIWNIELSASVAVLTEAQIVHAHNVQLISGADAYQRLRHKGYSDADAHILLSVRPGSELPA